MNKQQKTGEVFASSQTPCYADNFDLKHKNTMVVVFNQAELNYMCEWNEMHNILPPWLGKRDNYPIALSPNDGTWTDSMDRALYYIRFKDFVSLVA